MSKLTAVVVAKDNTEGLRLTLEALCDQSVEDFEVLIVQRGENEANIELIKSYCDEYVGFSYITVGDCLIPDARNAGAAKAGTEYLFFVNEEDYLSPETMESILKTANDTSADIISPRLYIAGENEPYYDTWMDMLATVPKIDRFDTALLNTLNAAGRVYKKKFFDLYSMRFPSTAVYYNIAFTAECVFKCDASVSGCAGAIYSKADGVFADGFVPGTEPDGKNMELLISIYDELTETVRTIIEEDTGSFDGDEYTFQELTFVYFSALTDDFYRYFWYLTNDDIKLLVAKYEELTSRMTPDRRKKMETSFADLRFPSMYMTREDAVNIPMISILADFAAGPEVGEFVRSLYNGRFPFFELFLKESNREFVDEKWIKNENLYFVEDALLFSEGRANCRALPITVKNPAPLDPKVLSELATVKAPKSFYQYIFDSKRKKTRAKTFLKKKGMNMR